MSGSRHIYTKPSKLNFSAAATTLGVAGLIAVALAFLSATGPARTPGHGARSSLSAMADIGAVVGWAGHSSSTVPPRRETAAQRDAAGSTLLGGTGLAATRIRSAARSAVRREARRTAARRETRRRQRVMLSGSPRQVAQAMLGQFGWPRGQFGCLDQLWYRESGWNPYAMNPSSGAYGIPQALPGSRMASAGANWRTSPATQIRWGLGYIRSTYGSPCGAWSHETSYGWY